MVLSEFRAHYPEFDAVRFPDPMLTVWATVGESRISADRFGTLYGHAVELFVAHNIKLAIGNTDAGSSHAPGGAVASKTVGPITVSYDTTASMLPGAGHWNQTVYGRQFAQLVRLMGGGCIQL